MGLYTKTGRNLKGYSLINHHSFWIIIGRPDYAAPSGGSPLLNPWPGDPLDVTVPIEDEDDTFPDEDLGDNIIGIGYKQADATSMVIPDLGGGIQFNGQNWSVSGDPQATHLYLRFVIDPSELTGDVVTTDLTVGGIEGYRRLTVVADPTPPGSVSSFRYNDLGNPAAHRGTVLFTDNFSLKPRLFGLNQRDVIEIVLLV